MIKNMNDAASETASTLGIGVTPQSLGVTFPPSRSAFCPQLLTRADTTKHSYYSHNANNKTHSTASAAAPH